MRITLFSVALWGGCGGDKPASSPGEPKDPSAVEADHCDTGWSADTGTEEPALEERCMVAAGDLDELLVRDTFSRSGPELGSTELGDLSYVEASGTDSGYATLSSEALLLHYFALLRRPPSPTSRSQPDCDRKRAVVQQEGAERTCSARCDHHWR